MDQNDWTALIRQIDKGTVTPFLGAGLNEPYLPLGGDIAASLSTNYGYPLDDGRDLIRVAQYVATIKSDPVRPKEDVLAILDDRLLKASAGVLSKETRVYSEQEPIGILADLPFPVYITTNYDPLIHNGLTTRGRLPRREICRWNGALQKDAPEFPIPSVESPVVYHLHGADCVQSSLVLTEDDYVTFLVNLKQDIIPRSISEKLAGGMLFIGYSLQDWNFRVLYQALVTAREAAIRHGSLSVQVLWEEEPARRRATETFLEKYFGDRQIRIYWGTAATFLRELKQRWGGR